VRYCVLVAALVLACAPIAAGAQVPLNSLSAASAPASTDTIPVCQTAGGCGTGNSLSAASAESYIRAAAAQSVTSSITAAGSSQSGATPLSAGVSIVTSAGQGTGVALPTATAGQVQTVCNQGAHPLRVYPASGAAITPGNTTTALTGTGGYVALPAGNCRLFLAASNTAWQLLPTTPANVFPVSDFGATGDGVTDDSSAIQAAINAAAAVTPCGAVVFPSGVYLVNSATLTIGTTEGCVLEGTRGRVYDAEQGGSVLKTTNTSFTLLKVNSACASQLTAGPTIDGLIFSEEDSGATLSDTLLSFCGVMRFHVMNSTFRQAGTGISVQGASGIDYSDSLTDGNLFYKNATAYLQGNASNYIGGQNAFMNNYIVTANASATGVSCIGQADGNLRIIGNRLDGPGTMVYSSCIQVTISNNTFEGGWTTAIELDETTAGSGFYPGGYTASVGNQFSAQSALEGLTATCTPVTSSTTWSCSTNPSTAGFMVGMEIQGTDVPSYSYCACGQSGSTNLLIGADYVTGVTSNSISVSLPATGNPGAETITACAAPYAILATSSYPSSHYPLPVATSGNTFVNTGNCYNGNSGIFNYSFNGQ
jgi:hypothetical protein